MFSSPVLMLAGDTTEQPSGQRPRRLLLGGTSGFELPSREIEILGFQGTGRFGSRLISTLAEARSVSRGWASLDDVVTALLGASGSFSLQVSERASGRVAWFTDPLGGAIIYRYSSGADLYFGSDPEQIATVARSAGATPQRDLRYFAGAPLTGTTVYGASAMYRNMDAVPAGVYVLATSSGEVSYIEYANPFSVVGENVSYETLLDRAADDIVENVIAAANTGSPVRLANLTGGFDSRLVLGAILAAGVKESFYFNSLANGSVDELIARQLCGHFGLRFTNEQGPMSAPIGNAAPFGIGNSWASSGAVPSGLDPRLLPADIVVLQGGYGECLRTFNSTDIRTIPRDVESLAIAMWQWADFPVAGARLNSVYSERFLDEVVVGLGGKISDIAQAGVPYEHWLSGLYLRYRNRYHIGLMSYYGSNISRRFDPLYSRVGAVIGNEVEFYARRSNLVGTDLLRRFSPELLSLPFDRQVLFPIVERKRGPVVPREYRNNPAEPSTLSWPSHDLLWTPEPSNLARAERARRLANSSGEELRSRVLAVGDLIEDVYDVDRLADAVSTANSWQDLSMVRRADIRALLLADVL